MASYYEQYVNEWVDVELVGRMPDGKPPRVRLRQLSPIEWNATRVGFPIQGIETDGVQLTPEQYREYIRDVVTRALVAMEVQDGDTGRRWQPVRIVPGTTSKSEWDIPIEVFDRPMVPPSARNVDRCMAALERDLTDGPPFDRVSGDTFRGRADGALVDSCREVPPKPARTRNRKAGRAR